MNKSLFVTKRTRNPRGYATSTHSFDVADNSQIAFTMYLLGHTDGAPYMAVYVDSSVRETAFWKLKSRIHRFEKRRSVVPVKLVREKPFTQMVKELVPAVFFN